MPYIAPSRFFFVFVLCFFFFVLCFFSCFSLLWFFVVFLSKVMDVSEAEMSQVFKAVAGVLNCGNVKFRDVLDNDKTTEVVGVLDEQAEAAEYARYNYHGCVRL